MPPVTEEGQKFRCEICGNVVTTNIVGGGTLICCNEEMILQD